MIALVTHAVCSGGVKSMVMVFDTTLGDGLDTITIPCNNTGVYNAKISWGDGTVSTITSWNDADLVHNYGGTPGIKTVRISGTLPQIYFNNGGDKLKLVRISKWGDILFSSFQNSFYGCANLDSTSVTYNSYLTFTDTPNLSAVTNISGIFRGCSSFNTSVNSWDVSAITDISLAFAGCAAFNQPLNSWNPLLNQSLLETFSSCTSFNQAIPNLCKSTVTNLTRTFNGATAFNQDISSWNVSNVTAFEAMFSGASSFNNGGSANINNWIFKSTGSISFQAMFQNAIAFNQPLNAWNVDRVTNMNFMFYNCDAFNQSLNSWNVSNVTIMTSMFSNTLLFNGNITSWIPTSLTNMGAMFANALAFNQDISGWNTSSVTLMNNVFQAGIFNQAIGIWNTSNVTNMAGMFASSVFNQNIGAWDVSKVTTFEAMFQGATLFNNGASSSISGWVLKTTGSVNCLAMFQNAAAFNQDISGWSYNVVTTMNNMLTTTTAFTTANYDLLLNALSAGVTLSSVLLGAGTKKYTIATAGAAHTNLTAVKLWTITDGGGI